MNVCSSFRVGEWFQCQSCGEETQSFCRDLLDWICSVCGACAPIIASEIVGRQRRPKSAD